MSPARSTARRRPLVRAALLATSVLATVAVGGCSSSPSTAPSMHDVAVLLAAHGRAVTGHDRAAFLAGLDGGQAAAGFRGRQRAAFANLVRLPLAAWSYRIESRTDERAAEKAESKKYGAAALIVRISVRYALRGFDRAPTAHELWWTFVRRGGRTVVAGDAGLADSGGVSWRGPWDFGPLAIVRGSNSLVLGHPDNAAALRPVDATVESAIPAVTAIWGRDWARAVVVIVPSTAAELAAQVGRSSPVTLELAAAAVSDGEDVLTRAVLGQRLIVNPAALRRLSAVGSRITLRHEVTHLAAASATTAATPRWLTEGFADYVGNLHSGQPVRTAASELRADVRRGKLPATLPPDASFETAGQAPQAYEQAWLACRLIAQRVGSAGLVRFYRAVGASTGGPQAAVAAALRSYVHQSTARFTADWRGYLKAGLR